MSARPENFELFSVFEKNEWLEKALAEAEAERDEVLEQLADLRAALVSIVEHGAFDDPTYLSRSLNTKLDAARAALSTTAATAGEFKAGVLEEAARISDEIGKREVFGDPRGFCRARSKTIADAIRAHAAKIREGK